MARSNSSEPLADLPESEASVDIDDLLLEFADAQDLEDDPIEDYDPLAEFEPQLPEAATLSDIIEAGNNLLAALNSGNSAAAEAAVAAWNALNLEAI